MSTSAGTEETSDVEDGGDALPVHSLGEGARVVRDVVRTGRPRILTENGVGIAVILDADQYQALRVEHAARELVRDLQEAIQAADAGDLVDHETVLQELRERYAGKVPPSVLREFDEA
jgi:hypothetical protein